MMILNMTNLCKLGVKQRKKSNNICKDRANIYTNGFMDLCGLK